MKRDKNLINAISEFTKYDKKIVEKIFLSFYQLFFTELFLNGKARIPFIGNIKLGKINFRFKEGFSVKAFITIDDRVKEDFKKIKIRKLDNTQVQYLVNKFLFEIEKKLCD